MCCLFLSESPGSRVSCGSSVKGLSWDLDTDTGPAPRWSRALRVDLPNSELYPGPGHLRAPPSVGDTGETVSADTIRLPRAGGSVKYAKLRVRRDSAPTLVQAADKRPRPRSRAVT